MHNKMKNELQSYWHVCLCAAQWNMGLTMSLISVEDTIHMAFMWISLESGYVTAELYIDINMPYYPSKIQEDTLIHYCLLTMSKQYPVTRQSTKHSTSGEVDEETNIYARILAAIKLAVREEMVDISTGLENIDRTLASFVEVQWRMEVVEESIQFTSERLNALATEVLPALSNHMARIAESLAHQTLQIDVHRRKWNVVIHGIDGPAGEDEGVTRSKCVNLLWRSSRLLMLMPGIWRTQASSYASLTSLNETGGWRGQRTCEAIPRKFQIPLTCHPSFGHWRTVWC